MEKTQNGAKGGDVMIKRELIEEILMRTDIEPLIGGYVSLKRAGSTLKGLCPFHSEKSPSFTVYPRDNSFYCFGCGVGGDAITFIKQIEHLDYVDAVEFLAKRAGITIPDDDRDRQPGVKAVDRSRVLEMNRVAAKWFFGHLFSDDPGARAALSYFQDKRRLSLATIKHFGLGYAPDSYSALTSYMKSCGYTDDELVESFLSGRNSNGKLYDTFRNRVMFPIIDVSGNVIAFGGRVMDDSKPKYRNSSDTPAFKKSRNIFALNFARLTCSESMILCEGYMDVIALHAAGFTNAVATLGTAITSEQARIMAKYTKKVVICYDSDEPGQKAAKRAMGMLEEVGLEVSVLKIPDAKDPDEYIKAYGADKFRKVIENSKSKFEYNMDSVLSKYDLSLPQDKINAVAELVKIISSVYSAAERDVYIQAVAEKTGVEAQSIRRDVESAQRRASYRARREESQNAIRTAQGYSDRVNNDYIKAPDIANKEEHVLGLLMLYPEYVKKTFTEGLLSVDDFFTGFNKRVFEYIKDKFSEGDTRYSDMDAYFTTEEVGRITGMKVARMTLGDNSETVFLQCADALRSAVSKKAEQPETMSSLEELLNKKRKELN